MRLSFRILVLDDEEGVVDVIVAQLTSDGYDCIGKTSPVEALELFEHEPFALLLTDLKMPEKTGMEVVAEAKKIQPDLAVVVLTALGDVTNAIEAMRAGVDDYILKPYNLGELTISVGRVLEKRRLTIENLEYQEQLEDRVDTATRNLEVANRELRETKEYLENLLNSSVDAIISTDRNNQIEFVNAGAERMFGYSTSEFLGMKMAKLYSGGANEVVYVRRKLRESKFLQNYETTLIRKDETAIQVNVSLSIVHSGDGQVESILAVCKDITQQKQLEAELKEMSIKDSLTELYNHRHFYDRLEGEIERSVRQGHPLTLLLFDVDEFKSYNDRHGHLEGDKALQGAAKAVLASTREHVDLGFRYGGDEYTVILPEAGEEQALLIAERIRNMYEEMQFDKLTLSIGLMTYREGQTLREFIRFTDAMMYEAKREGGNQVCVYRDQVLVHEPGEDESEEA